uniref:Large ribosomal subunit protein uL22m n=1 Tax=Arion vulgaris TaxID=1028688 RepID=A0A0B6XZL9_9EUPU
MATFRLSLQFLSSTRVCQSFCATVLHSKVSSSVSRLFSPTSALVVLQSQSSSCNSLYHTTTHRLSYRNTEFDENTPKRIGRAELSSPRWDRYNEVVYPPTQPGEPERPAEICHSRFQIKYSTKKMWYVSVMVRGLSIDEAIKQLAFHKRKGAAHVKEVIEEAQEMAVRDHNVEFKSNLWIADSYCTKGLIVKV